MLELGLLAVEDWAQLLSMAERQGEVSKPTNSNIWAMETIWDDTFSGIKTVFSQIYLHNAVDISLKYPLNTYGIKHSCDTPI